MGNKIARTTQVSEHEYYLHDLPSSYNLVFKEAVGNGRFFKSIICKHDEGLVLVKVYFKRGDQIDRKEYERRLTEIREIFQDVQHRHLWPFQFWLETDKAAYLLRQYFFSNLHDRLSTRPFLSLIEKKWLAFQLLFAVKQSHENGVCHGDIKCENVLVTSWNWVYLTDFASFKPTYIPNDDPSDFSFFFDTGGRRRCYLAPERFYEHAIEMQLQSDAPLKPSMDIFSLGCVIAELFLEGQPLFELSQLLAYRRRQYDPCPFLEKIPDAGIRKMILHMIQLDPETRLSCESYLQEYGSIVFPGYFTPFLHKFFSCLIPVDPDTRVAVTQGAFQEIQRQIIGSESCENIAPNTDEFCEKIKPASKHRIASLNEILGNKHEAGEEITSSQSQLIGEITCLLKSVEQRESTKTMPENVSSNTNNATMITPNANHLRQKLSNQQYVPMSMEYIRKEGHYPLRRILRNDLKSLIDKYNSEPDALLLSFFPGDRCTLRCEGMLLITSLLCSCMHSAKQPQLRRGALLMLMSSSLYIDSEDLLQHLIPYIILMLSDTSAIVRCAALEALCNILPLVEDFPPSDAKIFPEYILPMLSKIPDDSEESVRICYASNIFKIALTSYRFLYISSNLSESDVVNNKQPLSTKLPSSAIEIQGKKQILSMDVELSKLRKSIAEIIQELVMGNKNTPGIRRALLQDIGHLCYFFGQSQSNDFLLPILPAFLNDRDEQLRSDFYAKIVFVCFFVGQKSVEEYLFPYIEQAIDDDMEVVTVNALECLTMLSKSRLLKKNILLEMIERAFPLLFHPILWVKRAAVCFIAASSESLGPVDSDIYLYSLLRPFLHRKPPSLSSEVTLLSCLKSSTSKHEFYQILQDARSSEVLERHRKIWYNSGYSNQMEAIEHADRNHSNEENVVSKDTSGKSRIIGSTSYNNVDSIFPEKQQFSGIMSTHVAGGNSLLYDKRPSEGIPMYSFSMGKRFMLIGTSSSDTLLQWISVGVGSPSPPLLDPVSKSFLSTTEHPKLFSGSIYNISNASKKIPLSLQDLESNEIDRSSVLNRKIHDLSVSDALKASTAASLEDISPQSDTSSALTSYSSNTTDTGWRPRGVLMVHLQEHRSAVNDIAISNDNNFFVSASDDSTVKVWDTHKLEKDISFRSRLTYHLDGTKALCTTMLNGGSQVVVGASDGQIHLFSVDYISKNEGGVERYSGIADIQKKQVGEGAIRSILNCPAGNGSYSHTVLYSTQLCGIQVWDTRIDSMSWRFKANPDEGCVSSLVMGACGNWFVSGTSMGVLTLWDMRFLLPVNSWRYSRVCPVEKICSFIPTTNSTVFAMGRPLIYVAAGCNEVSLWNAENGSCHQVFRTAGCEGVPESPSNIPWALTKSCSKQNMKRNSTPKYGTDDLSEPPHRLPGVRSLLPLPGGDLLTGGTDRKIRYWDHNSPGRSFCVCGPSKKVVASKDVYDLQSRFGIQIVQETNHRPTTTRSTEKLLHAVACADSASFHCDSILSLASVKLNHRFLISGSRDGAVKVWK